MSTESLPFLSHLVELRDRLLRMVLCVLLIFVTLSPFIDSLFATFAQPLIERLPAGTTLIATKVAAPFLTPFKLALVLSVYIAVPYILYHFWAFVAPGLYRSEKKLILPLLISSTFLFYLGIAFAHFIVLPLVFDFLISTTPVGVAMMTDISEYLSFTLTIFFAFGVAFEVPIATFLVVWAGWMTPEELLEKRPYIIVVAFIIGMFLTPPDMISQTLLAIPMWFLFEIGVIFAKYFVPKRREEETFNELSEVEMDNELDHIEQQEKI